MSKLSSSSFYTLFVVLGLVIVFIASKIRNKTTNTHWNVSFLIEKIGMIWGKCRRLSGVLQNFFHAEYEWLYESCSWFLTEEHLSKFWEILRGNCPTYSIEFFFEQMYVGRLLRNATRGLRVGMRTISLQRNFMEKNEWCGPSFRGWQSTHVREVSAKVGIW